SKSKYTNVALVVRNIGGQLTTYYDEGDSEKIPLNVQAGISSRLKHAPVIFSLNLQHLNNWDLANPEPKKPNEEGALSFLERDESFGKQLMRHIVFGVELLPSENFVLRAGYNYQRR